MKKKLTTIFAGVLTGTLLLAGCGNSTQGGGGTAASQAAPAESKGTITVAATAVPHAEILEEAQAAINVANELKGAAVDTDADGTMYILAKDGDKVGFYKATGTIPAGKAYYQSTSGVKAFFFEGEDDPTGIDNLNVNDNLNDVIYNLAGQRIQKMQKGINIINNKKVLR